jgi:hypothetical protein
MPSPTLLGREYGFPPRHRAACWRGRSSQPLQSIPSRAADGGAAGAVIAREYEDVAQGEQTPRLVLSPLLRRRKLHSHGAAYVEFTSRSDIVFGKP